MKVIRYLVILPILIFNSSTWGKGKNVYFEPHLGGSYYRWNQSLEGTTEGAISGYAYSYSYGFNLHYNISSNFSIGYGYKESFVNWRYVEDKGYADDNDWKTGSAGNLNEQSIMIAFLMKSNKFILGYNFSSTLKFSSYYISGIDETELTGTGQFIGLQRALNKNLTWSLFLKSNAFNKGNINSNSVTLPETVNGIELSPLTLNSVEINFSWPIGLF